jgi:hypothetical protein
VGRYGAVRRQTRAEGSRARERQRREGGSTIKRGVETVAMLLGESGEQRTARCLVMRRAVYAHNPHHSRPQTHSFTRPNDSSGSHSQPVRDDGRSHHSRYQSSVSTVGCAAITARSLSHLAHQPSCISKSTLQIKAGIPQTPDAPI